MSTPGTRTTAGDPVTRRPLDDRRLPVQARVAAAWTSFMFFYLYVDYLHFYKPGSIQEILGGTVHEFETGPAFVGTALTLLAVPMLMVVLSAALPARANRVVNLVAATLYIPFSIYNATGEQSFDYAWFYGLSIGLEVLLLVYVLRTVWTWPRVTAAPARSESSAPARAMAADG